MVKQKSIQIHDTTFNLFRLVKVKFSAKKEKQLSDNEFIVNLLDNLVNSEGLLID